jgi:hypothetical protein
MSLARAVTAWSRLAKRATARSGGRERSGSGTCLLWTCSVWRDERADLAALLATLSPRQWQAPTLCAGWRVRDVVAHVVSYDDLDARGLMARLVRGRFRPGRVKAATLARYDWHSPEQLLGC